MILTMPSFGSISSILPQVAVREAVCLRLLSPALWGNPAQDFIWFVIVYMLSYLFWWRLILEQTRLSSLSPMDMGRIEGLFLGMTTRGEILMKPSFPSFP